jgi:hypothetical protein
VRWLEDGVLAGVDPRALLGVFERSSDRRRVADQLLAVGQVEADRLTEQLPSAGRATPRPPTGPPAVS